MSDSSVNDAQGQIQQLQQEIFALKRSAEDQQWGLDQTNKAIKTLYRELEKKNRDLEKLDQLKSDFIATVSHELRTPMTVIKESIVQILDGLAGETSGQQQQLLGMALKNIDRLSRIINNLLDINKLEAGRIILSRESFDAAALIEEVCQTFSPQIQRKGLELRKEIASGHVSVFADRDRLTQVLINLLHNAIKFTDDGYIRVSAECRDGQFVCRVADSGRGIDDEDMAKTFDKFQQFGRQEGSVDVGTGLGLAIAKHIIDLHQGRIYVESELDKGTTFTFQIPCGE